MSFSNDRFSSFVIAFIKTSSEPAAFAEWGTAAFAEFGAASFAEFEADAFAEFGADAFAELGAAAFTEFGAAAFTEVADSESDAAHAGNAFKTKTAARHKFALTCNLRLIIAMSPGGF